MSDTALPVTVIGGYLGAGKTTMVNHLLRHADGVRLAILVNEFGELAIDEDLIEAQDDDIISIAGGCVCCSFGSDLGAALMDMSAMQPPPDHILIESSGVAIPGAIVASVGLLNGFRADGIVIVADAETIQRSARDKYMGDTVLRQLSDADIVVLNKVDLISPDNLKVTREWLGDHAKGARILEVEQGRVPRATVLDSYLARPHAPGPHHEAAHLMMHTLIPPKGADAQMLGAALAAPGLGLIRAKGFVTQADGSKALVQVVGNRFEVTAARDDRDDGIVCLGFRELVDMPRLKGLGV